MTSQGDRFCLGACLQKDDVKSCEHRHKAPISVPPTNFRCSRLVSQSIASLPGFAWTARRNVVVRRRIWRWASANILQPAMFVGGPGVEGMCADPPFDAGKEKRSSPRFPRSDLEIIVTQADQVPAATVGYCGLHEKCRRGREADDQRGMIGIRPAAMSDGFAAMVRECTDTPMSRARPALKSPRPGDLVSADIV